jgi:anti-sigma regulatory factor (Ser/Thr protein kinase)
MQQGVFVNDVNCLVDGGQARAGGAVAPSVRPVAGAEARFTDQLTLAALPSAVGAARAFVRLALAKWHGGAEQADDALLIVSELVTNAVRAVGVVEVPPRWVDLGAVDLVTVTLTGLADSLVIEVRDPAPGLPVPAPAADPSAEGGRGLHLVAALSTRWGWTPDRRGKSVWAETLPSPGYAAARR